MSGFRFRCIIFMLRLLCLWMANIQCVCTRGCPNTVERRNSRPFGNRTVVQLADRYFNEWATAGNGHHSATYKNEFLEQQSNSPLATPMFEQANTMTALKMRPPVIWGLILHTSRLRCFSSTASTFYLLLKDLQHKSTHLRETSHEMEAWPFQTDSRQNVLGPCVLSTTQWRHRQTEPCTSHNLNLSNRRITGYLHK
jgi:hypothetical protein